MKKNKATKKKKAIKKKTIKKKSAGKMAGRLTQAAVRRKRKKAAKKGPRPRPGIVGTCGQWRAVHDFMPPGPAVLRVSGVCTFPTPGYKVTLTPSVPQGINPEILMLEKTVQSPSGIEPQIVTKVDVRFEYQSDFRYTKVDIHPDGVQIRVENVY